jgi:hypothetical protein
MNLTHAWRTFWEWVHPRRRLQQVVGDALPAVLPWRDLIVLSDGSEAWSVAMNCPCGCGQQLELPVLSDVTPRWTLTTDERNRPTLHPSVAMRDGCKSHFWVRRGRVFWCDR